MLIISTASSAPKYDPSPFGMNGLKMAHNRKNPNIWADMERVSKIMKDAGMHWDRLELWWNVVEPEKGRFDWTFADQVAKFYRDNGMNACVILCYSSAWSNNTPPATPEEREAYANYVYQVVSRYKDTFKVWEIWNEPNIPTFWPKPNVKDYTLMLREAYEAAKKADPGCTVLAAATSGPDLGFIEGIHENGGWDSCDGISIHPYSMAGGPLYQRLDKILRLTQSQIAGCGKPKPLWITEMGWTSRDEREDRNQAVYLVQSYAIALANGVENLMWFCLDDWGEKWGLVRSYEPFDPKPSYEAYRMLTEALGSPGPCAEFEGYASVGKDVACYVFGPPPPNPLPRGEGENRPKPPHAAARNDDSTPPPPEGGGRGRGIPDGKRVLILWSMDGSRRAVTLRQKSGLDAKDVLGNEIDVKEGRFAVADVPVIVTNADPALLGTVSRTATPNLERKGRDLLNNGSLDVIHGSNPGWWTPGRFDSTAKDGKFETSGLGRNGSGCVSISGSGERAVWDASPIPVEPGKRYRLTGWLKTQDATGESSIALYWYTGNMWTYIGEERTEYIAGTGDWFKASVAAEAPRGATFVRVNLISTNNTGTTWFDDIELVEE